MIRTIIYKLYGVSATPEMMSGGAAVICNIINKPWDITARLDTMFAGATVICMMVYEV